MSHRRCARVPSAPVKHDLAARLTDDRCDDPERLVEVVEDRALLDVEFEVRLRKIPSRNRRFAADAPSLFVTERDDNERQVGSFGNLDPGENTENPVVLAAVRHRVEMRADPHLGVATAPDRVLRLVNSHLKPRRLHPGCDQPVGCILFERIPNPRRVNRVDDLEACVEHAHRVTQRRGANSAVTPVPDRRRSSSTARRPVSP
ncbi:unannotated protein [freshwater metagenome]|uniref:Unannotated protein n=1 Tax=freshwater metagenome TaxID=449393 RepID=A0A6J6NBQ2_9ZZZZ